AGARRVGHSGAMTGPVQPSAAGWYSFYDAYACADGGFVTIGSIEPQFYAQLLTRLGLDDVDPVNQYDKATWPELEARIAALLRTRPCAHWCALLEGSDVCFAPVLSMAQATQHPHNIARGIYTQRAQGAIKVAAAPCFTALTPS
ncbi:MAG: CoA transferase, partial [Burkholderiaceae bacterium]